jgi:hypothetical protein
MAPCFIRTDNVSQKTITFTFTANQKVLADIQSLNFCFSATCLGTILNIPHKGMVFPDDFTLGPMTDMLHHE